MLNYKSIATRKNGHKRRCQTNQHILSSIVTACVLRLELPDVSINLQFKNRSEIYIAAQKKEGSDVKSVTLDFSQRRAA